MPRVARAARLLPALRMPACARPGCTHHSLAACAAHPAAAWAEAAQDDLRQAKAAAAAAPAAGPAEPAAQPEETKPDAQARRLLEVKAEEEEEDGAAVAGQAGAAPAEEEGEAEAEEEEKEEVEGYDEAWLKHIINGGCCCRQRWTH